ncbi:MAG: phosphate/phosphite/phosphonate ABC transporter substrate-binding protein [Elainellaceae cyanobacterium]
MLIHRFSSLGLILTAGLLLSGCGSQSSPPIGKLTIGIVSYDSGERTVEQYQQFKDYLAQQTQTVVELEPAFNELQAVEQIQKQNEWSIVFAPPGLAAIAISDAHYIPIFPIQGIPNLRSVLVVQEDSEIESIGDLANTVIALGEPGSATGYYLPLYDLYGLTLQEVRFAPTPRTVLEWISDGEVVAGAIAEPEFQRYKNEFPDTDFRILHTSRVVPIGAVLVGPTVDRNQQQQIEAAMQQAPSNIVGDAGYIPNYDVPNYDQFIQLVEKVRPLEAQILQQPAVLTLPAESDDAE